MLFHPKPSSLSPAWFFLFYKLMKEIQLTQGKVALVDDEDFDYLNQWKWYAKKCSKNGIFYAVRCITINNKNFAIYMHRFILNNNDSKMHTDHRNGTTLDNRKENIRICTASQNSINKKINSRNKSGYKGISFCNRSKRFVAEICLNGKRYYLGQFIDRKEAAKAYNIGAIKFHGEFAKLNNI
jgi:hypothetical protein